MHRFTSATLRASDRFTADSCGWRPMVFNAGSDGQRLSARHTSKLRRVGRKAPY